MRPNVQALCSILELAAKALCLAEPRDICQVSRQAHSIADLKAQQTQAEVACPE